MIKRLNFNLDFHPDEERSLSEEQSWNDEPILNGSDDCPAAFFPCSSTDQRTSGSTGFTSGPASMVGMGFRCWVRGTQTHDTRFFDVCSRQYIQHFGLKDGIVLTTRLGHWVDTLDKFKSRPLSIHQHQALGFSFDEVIAISMIAACQHAECPALQACLYALTQAADLERPQQAAQDFADGLIDAGQILSPDCIAMPLKAMALEGISLTH